MTPSYSSRLSPRDLAVIKTVSIFGQATTSQLLRLHFSEPMNTARSRHQRACRSLKRLWEWKEIGRIERPRGGGMGGSGENIYIPTTARVRERNPHTLDITELCVRLGELHVSGGAQLVRFLPEEYGYETYGNTTVTPDAKVEMKTGTGEYEWYIEVDRSTEFGPQLSAKMRKYLSAWNQRSKSFFPVVLFTVLDEERAKAIKKIIQRQEKPEMFRVTLFDEAIKTLGE